MRRLEMIRPIWYLVAALVMAAASPAQIASGSQGSSEPAHNMFLQEAPGTTPQQGPPGSLFTVRASGFRSFVPVQSIKLGIADVLGNRTINTDADGAFTAVDLQVPGLDPGRYVLFVTVGSGDSETTVTGIFEVTAQEQAASSDSPATGLAPLLDADNLVRVFLFRNSTKDWLFYDPRPAFAAANTLDELLEGKIYWIKIRRNQEATLNEKPRNLTCANPGTPSENCWNLVVW